MTAERICELGLTRSLPRLSCAEPCTGNLNPDRTAPSLFEPVHGSAHDAVGTDKVNPSSQILSAVMLLEFLGEAEAAARIRKALDDVLASDPAPLTIGDLVAERV